MSSFKCGYEDEKSSPGSDLGCGDPQVDAQLGSGHHEGVENVVAISDPADCKPFQITVVLLHTRLFEKRQMSVCVSVQESPAQTVFLHHTCSPSIYL